MPMPLQVVRIIAVSANTMHRHPVPLFISVNFLMPWTWDCRLRLLFIKARIPRGLLQMVSTIPALITLQFPVVRCPIVTFRL